MVEEGRKREDARAEFEQLTSSAQLQVHLVALDLEVD
jgi:hypothetical protein